ncbi:YoaK family protein [Streptomyces sp. NPDC052107]|uniref:YoaK family protein n=1 Tax=Streptomyces sp. NPDC052107 TaxID=3155632 RepID=UPI00341550B2
MNPHGPGTGRDPAHPPRLLGVLTVLTMVTGLVDAISYLGLGHVFTANMTGNVVIIAFALVGAPGFSLPASVISLAAFVVGAVAAGRMELALRRRPRHHWLRACLAVEAGLLGAASAVAFALPSGGVKYSVIALTALAMGMRNGTVRKLAVPDMTTTVLTLTVTGLAFDSSLAGGTNPRALRRVAAVVVMLAGALLGGWLVLHHDLGWPLLISAVTVAVTVLVLSPIPDEGA